MATTFSSSTISPTGDPRTDWLELVRQLGLERLLRDAHGAQFHPLPEKRQQLFTGRLALGSIRSARARHHAVA